VNSVPRILCAIDLSRPSVAAFDYGLAAAKSRGGELDLLFAAPGNRRFSWRAPERTAFLTRHRLSASAAGVPVRVSVQHGNPADVILLHAHSSNTPPPDLLVLGTHGRQGLDRLRFGSIAERVLHAAPCPTLIVRAPVSGDKSARPLNRILCAVDHSPASLSAVQYSIRLLKEGGTALTLLHVVSATTTEMPRFAWAFAGAGSTYEITATAWMKLDALLPLSKERRDRMRIQVTVGQLAEEIARESVKMNADVVVMGVEARGVLGRLIGSSTARVLRSVDRPLIAVPRLRPGVTSEEWPAAALTAAA
jgi:nucleotide-binding universal stress UspA family protein